MDLRSLVSPSDLRTAEDRNGPGLYNIDTGMTYTHRDFNDKSLRGSNRESLSLLALANNFLNQSGELEIHA